MEPLNIIVTSQYFEKYEVACCLVQELILNVYEEYKAFCAKYKRKPNADFNLQIKKEETVSRPKPIPEDPPNTRELKAMIPPQIARPEKPFGMD